MQANSSKARLAHFGAVSGATSKGSLVCASTALYSKQRLAPISYGVRGFSSMPSGVEEGGSETLASIGMEISKLKYEHEETMLIFRVFQSALESVHDGSLIGFAPPWWGVIIGSTVVLRLFVAFPAFVYRQRGIQKMNKFDAVVDGWSALISKQVLKENADKQLSKHEFQSLARRRISIKRQELLTQHGCHPLLYALVSFAQLPIWISMTFALRRLSRGVLLTSDDGLVVIPPDPGMLTEGLLWFKDLSVVDPTYILPICTCAVYLLNSVLAHHWSKITWDERSSSRENPVRFEDRPEFTKVLTVLSFVFPFIIGYGAAISPAAIPFYWMLSSALRTLQLVLLFNNRTRRLILKK
ncbi:Cytochrome c oxidase assembly protein cox18, mitochondrial [Coemansia sp. RSA 2049]|nr:Cytochrome c oxidase assembly protein cox18, mitochondrial [Coemansia sp. RSA 2049]